MRTDSHLVLVLAGGRRFPGDVTQAGGGGGGLEAGLAGGGRHPDRLAHGDAGVGHPLLVFLSGGYINI